MCHFVRPQSVQWVRIDTGDKDLFNIDLISITALFFYFIHLLIEDDKFKQLLLFCSCSKLLGLLSARWCYLYIFHAGWCSPPCHRITGMGPRRLSPRLLVGQQWQGVDGKGICSTQSALWGSATGVPAVGVQKQNWTRHQEHNEFSQLSGRLNDLQVVDVCVVTAECCNEHPRGQ